jgi:hypothetical protein
VESIPSPNIAQILVEDNKLLIARLNRLAAKHIGLFLQQTSAGRILSIGVP